MFKSLTAWLSGGDSTSSSRKNLAMSYTRDAFSLPTHSPTLTPHAPYMARTPSTDNFDSDAAPPSYTYPPTSNDESLNFMPSSPYDTPSRSTHQASLLPLHHTSVPPLQSCPPLSNTWTRIRSWLSEDYSELGDTLNWGVTQEVLQDIELTLGFSLPGSVRESYLVADGQEPESLNGSAEGLFFGLTFLPLEEAVEEWNFWRTVDEDPSTGSNANLKGTMQSIPPGYIRREYSQRGWFPLITDKAGNYLGVDLNPDECGTVGQVIVFGRDFDMKVVMWGAEGDGGWGKWLASFADELEGGEGFEVGGGEASEGSDDGIGYESYFFDGSGHNQGEGGASKSGGGLRLTGEYRGWPVLEAWADRSYRRWNDAGLVKVHTLNIPQLIVEKPLPQPTDEEPLVPLSTSTASTLDIEASTPTMNRATRLASVDGPTIGPLSFMASEGNPVVPTIDESHLGKESAPLSIDRSSLASSSQAPLQPLVIGADATLVPLPNEPSSSTLLQQEPPAAALQEARLISPVTGSFHAKESEPLPEALRDRESTEHDTLQLAQETTETLEPRTEVASEIPTVRLVGGGGTSGSIEGGTGGDATGEDVNSEETPSQTVEPPNSSTAPKKTASAIAGGLKKLGSLGSNNTRWKKDTV